MTWPARYVYVCAIEGVDTLLTDAADTGAVLAAWSGTDWSSATSGLFVDLDQRQSGNPWEPFQPGGVLTLTIADEQIGILTHRTAGGAETELADSVDQSEDTIPVKDTSAFPSEGVVHIGTEAIAYTGKTSTSFTGCTRGMWSPFGNGTANRYAHSHRLGVVGYGPSLAPRVTQYPRTWVGRWVGLWVHGYNSDGTLQTRSSAKLVFAGRLVEVRDDVELLSTVIVAEHLLTMLREATVGRDMLSGEIADGIYIPASGAGGQGKFTWKDETAGVWREANPLVVVPSGASGTNQMDEGFYTHSELFTKLNEWLAGERIANRLWGTYTFGIATTQGTPESQRTKVYWSIAGTAGSTVRWRGTMHRAIGLFLGFEAPSTGGGVTIGDSDLANEIHHYYQDGIPLRTWVDNGLSNIALRVVNATGAFQDQLDTIPASFDLPANPTGEWGVFAFDEQVLVRAKVTDNGDGTLDLHNVWPVLVEQTGPFFENPLRAFAKGIDDRTPTKIRQVFVFEMRFGEFLNQFFYSSGTPGYNHATYDVLPFGCGLGIPHALLGQLWELSVANLPGADKMIAPLIDKPTKVSTLLGSDLLLRHAFPIWRGGLSMGAWQTPTNANAIAVLTEDNKAEPSGRDVNHRSPTLLSDRWAKPLIKIEYNRDAIRGGYKGTINVEDRTAIDDSGDRGSPFTIEARNTLESLAATGAGIEELVPTAFVPVVTLFTKPLRTLKRSASLELWDLAPGDIVTVTDEYARDPTTGIRRVTRRPGVVMASRSNPGGARPGTDKPGPVVGELEVFFIETNRIYAYAPSALIDSTANSGGFTAGYNSSSQTIRCVEHAYSEASEPADATHFAADDFVTVHEVDPSDPSSAQSWTGLRIVSINGNDITLDGSLSGFDSGKTYRLIYGLYEEATLEQREKAFQADADTGLVFEGTAQPYQFGLVTSPVNATLSQHTTLPELHAELTYGDGLPYDVGSLVGFARLVENLIDHKTAIQSPFLSNTVLTNTTYSSGSGYRIVWMAPIYLSAGLLSNSVVRYLRVAPWFRSSDGTLTKVRVSLCRTRPEGDTLDDGDRGEVFSDAEWTTSSTSWQIPTRALLTCNVKNTFDGLAWIVIECCYKAETRGLAECTEQERMTF